MSEDYSEEFLICILERALDSIEAGRREHIYRWAHGKGRKVAWHYDRDIERLSACYKDGQITDEDDYWGIILDCLETALENPKSTYKKPQEPISSHDEAKDLEMFAFVVQLDDFTRQIYTKFCLKELTDGSWYVSIDCHP